MEAMLPFLMLPAAFVLMFLGVQVMFAMMITAVLVFTERMSVEALRALVDARFLAYARFRQKAVDAATGCGCAVRRAAKRRSPASNARPSMWAGRRRSPLLWATGS